MTVDKDKFGSTQTNFPVAVFLSSSSGIGGIDTTAVFDELGSDANRKKIAITSSDGTTQLYVEIERWDTANEIAVLHVKVSSISGSTDTVLYLYYDAAQSNNDSFVGDTTDAVTHNVWDANFKAVYHMASAAFTYDSTINASDGSQMTTLIDSPVGKASSFDGVSERSNITPVYLDDAAGTVEGVVRLADGVANEQAIYGEQRVTQSVDGVLQYSIELGTIKRFSFHLEAAGWKVALGNDGVLPNIWYHVAGTWGAKMELFVNGSSEADDPHVGGTTRTSTAAYIGRQSNNQGGYFKGDIDEVRISDIVRSDNWISSTYESLFDNTIMFGGSASLLCSFTETDLTSRIRVLLKDTIGREWTDTQISNELKIAAEDLSSRSMCVETVSDITTSSGVVDYASPEDATSIVSCVYDGKGLQRIHPRMVRHLALSAIPDQTIWNATDKSSSVILESGGLGARVVGPTGIGSVRATNGKSTGKRYFEIQTAGVIDSVVHTIGLMDASHSLGVRLGLESTGWGFNENFSGGNAGKTNNGGQSTGDSRWFSGDLIMVAVDFDALKIWWGVDGVWHAGGDPGAGTGAMFTNVSGTLFPGVSLQAPFASDCSVLANFGATAFTYSIPSGFLSWDSRGGSPEYWYYHNGRIGIWPEPDSAYTVNVYHSKVTEDLTEIPCFLRPLLVWHSVARLRGSEGWVDDEALFKKMYDNSVDFSKEQFFTPGIDSLDMFSNG